MSDGKHQVTIPGGGFLTLLTLLFVGLKLGHVIDWHWVWVLSPIWLPSAMLIVVVVVVFLLYLVGNALHDLVRKRDV
jgi:hypothetical protein